MQAGSGRMNWFDRLFALLGILVAIAFPLGFYLVNDQFAWFTILLGLITGSLTYYFRPLFPW